MRQAVGVLMCLMIFAPAVAAGPDGDSPARAAAETPRLKDLTAAPGPTEARRLIRRARRHMDASMYRAAAKELRKARALAPGTREADQAARMLAEVRVLLGSARVYDRGAPPVTKAVAHPQGERPATAQPPPDPADASARSRLEMVLSIEFSATPLRDALDMLAAASGATIVLDPVAESDDRPVTLRADRMKLGHVLDWITDFTGLRHTVRNGAVFVSTPARTGGESVAILAQCLRSPVRYQRLPGPFSGIPGEGPTIDSFALEDRELDSDGLKSIIETVVNNAGGRR